MTGRSPLRYAIGAWMAFVYVAYWLTYVPRP